MGGVSFYFISCFQKWGDEAGMVQFYTTQNHQHWPQEVFIESIACMFVLPLRVTTLPAQWPSSDISLCQPSNHYQRSCLANTATIIRYLPLPAQWPLSDIAPCQSSSHHQRSSLASPPTIIRYLPLPAQWPLSDISPCQPTDHHHKPPLTSPASIIRDLPLPAQQPSS